MKWRGDEPSPWFWVAWAVAGLAGLAFWVGVVIVAFHFLAKWW